MTFPVEPLHPRPQLARAGWIDLCGEWRFVYDDLDVGLAEHWWNSHVHLDRTILVPFPPESPASGIGDPSFHPVVWYARTVRLTIPARAKRVILHFGAIDYEATVWVNSMLVASHRGGHTPLDADITDVLIPGDAQFIVVRAEDQPGDLAQPRGKQDWQEELHEIWYQRTTGSGSRSGSR